MQREIKFRAWDGRTMHEWGFLKEGTFMGPPSSSKGNFQTMKHMQFTGLKDKNGVKIYEGDIANITHTILNPPEENRKVVELRITERGIMRFNEKSAQFSFLVENSILQEDWQSLEIEVISNIYEHSKLLKEAK